MVQEKWKYSHPKGVANWAEKAWVFNRIESLFIRISVQVLLDLYIEKSKCIWWHKSFQGQEVVIIFSIILPFVKLKKKSIHNPSFNVGIKYNTFPSSVISA